MEFIDLKKQYKLLKNNINKRINNVFEHGQYILGPEVFKLEEVLKNYLGDFECISVSSGTDALLVSLMAIDVQEGDEIITTPYTWISTAEVIKLIGAKPVFVDIDEKTWNIDPNLIEENISEKTKAIIPVGIYGQTANMSEITKIAERNNNLHVIEDAAQCFGATHKNKKSCTLSSISATSFFPSKPLGAYGDGGAVFTNDLDLAEKMKWIRNHGQKEKHFHPILGINGRLDTIQAAILLEKFNVFEKEVKLRQEAAKKYNSLINSDYITKPYIEESNSSVYAQYTITSKIRDEIKDYLNKHSVPAVSYYTTPLHLQPVFSYLGYKRGDFPVTEKISSSCLSLPMHPYLSKEEQVRVSKYISEVK